MKIILFGSRGQVGSHLKPMLTEIGEVKACTRDDCDLERPEQIKQVIENYSPNLIINAAAYTNVDKAESDQLRAELINAKAPGIMAEVAKKLGAAFISYSTDYVFDGTKTTPYIESDNTNPLSVYGSTKLIGEENIKESGCKYLILRTSWVYSAAGSNFINTIIRLAKERDELRVVNDQIGSPTSAEFIADTTIKCIKKGIDKENSGLYHLTAKDYVSWYEFARHIVGYLAKKGENFRLNADDIKPVSSNEYKTAATRPKYSVLNSELIEKTFDIKISPWKYYVDKILDQYKLTDRS
jgi:dTDP-4-dehydrorhamnose reductase